jgi:hypothetical protein
MSRRLLLVAILLFLTIPITAIAILTQRPEEFRAAAGLSDTTPATPVRTGAGLPGDREAVLQTTGDTISPSSHSENSRHGVRLPSILPESNVRMAARLEAMNQQIHVETFSYRNDKHAELLRRRLSNRSASPGRLQAHFQYVYALLLAGQTREALDHDAKLEQAINQQGIKLAEPLRTEVAEIRAVSYLRLGEQENCLQRPCCFSCIFPLRREAVHELPEGSENAVKAYTALLEEHPENLMYRWLLNVAYQTIGKYPKDVPSRWLIPPKAFESEYPLPQFADVASEAGLADVDLAGGVCMDDFDGDGLLDIVRTSFGVESQMKFFHNNGDGSFSERSKQSLLTGQLGGLNVTHADYDNDGHLDLFVLRGAWLGVQGKFPNSLLRNRGDGTFEDTTDKAGVLSFHPTQVAAWGDFNNDGWLDVFIGNESLPEHPHPCELYRNNRDGTFTNVASEMGVDLTAFVKGAAWGDYDNDGLLDLYVSAIYGPNMLFRNEGKKFSDVTEKAGGVSGSGAGFPCWFFDYDNDGWLDILAASFLNGNDSLDPFVREYLGQPAGDVPKMKLYRNRRNGTFEDVSAKVNLDRPMMAMGANFGDLDNDGWLDFYFGTGNPRYQALLPNRMFRNDRGRVFQDVTTAGGFGHLQKGHGVAFGDLDNDGDQDVFIVMGGAYTGDIFRCVLFENPLGGNHWIKLRFTGVKSNRFGVGARVRVLVADPDGSHREMHRVVGGTASFGSNPMQLEIGLGACQRVVSVDVQWPVTGQTDRFSDLVMDRCYRITEGSADVQVDEHRKFVLGSTPLTHGVGNVQTSATPPHAGKSTR